MAITKVLDLIEDVADLNVANLRLKAIGAPQDVVPADLPASYVRNVFINEGPLTTKTHGGWPEFSFEYVVLVNALQLSTPRENFEETLTMMDNVSTALRGATQYDPGGTNTVNLAKGPISWDMELSDDLLLGDTVYWAVITRITAYG